MRLSVVIQLTREEPIVGELEGMPDPSAQFVVVHTPRRRDGRPVEYLDDNVDKVLLAWHRINHIQILSDINLEKAIGFVRE